MSRYIVDVLVDPERQRLRSHAFDAPDRETAIGTAYLFTSTVQRMLGVNKKRLAYKLFAVSPTSPVPVLLVSRSYMREVRSVDRKRARAVRGLGGGR